MKGIYGSWWWCTLAKSYTKGNVYSEIANQSSYVYGYGCPMGEHISCARFANYVVLGFWFVTIKRKRSGNVRDICAVQNIYYRCMDHVETFNLITNVPFSSKLNVCCLSLGECVFDWRSPVEVCAIRQVFEYNGGVAPQFARGWSGLFAFKNDHSVCKIFIANVRLRGQGKLLG